jgi:endonuclease G
MLAALLMLSACGDDEGDVVVGPGTNPSGGTAVVNNNKNTSGPAEARYRLEFPKLKGGDNVVIVHHAIMNKNTKVEGVNYSVEWSPTINAQRWSCYQMYSSVNYHSSYNVSRYRADNDGSLSAECQYPNDPDLPEAYRMTADPYKYNGYDHGHICPSADRLRSAESNYQTFYITNMQPQLNVFNAGIWEKMEEQVRTWASACDTLFVCKGGTIDKQEHVLGQLTDQIKRENRIPVPRYFFMALLSKKGNNYKATAFWVEHLNEDHTNDALRNYAYSIDWLEQQTGIDFFCNLPDDIEDMVESKMTPSEWGLK